MPLVEGKKTTAAAIRSESLEYTFGGMQGYGSTVCEVDTIVDVVEGP